MKEIEEKIKDLLVQIKEELITQAYSILTE